MILEPIGYLTVLLGALCLLQGARFGIVVLCLSTLFGAAAAFNLPALGGASIQPSHLLLMFFAASCVLRPVQAQAVLVSLRYPGPGFWFAGYIIFSVLSAMFLPRIFAGATLVYSSARDASGSMSTIAAPLAPGTSNLTQSVYLLGDLVCFALVSGLAQLGYARFIASMLIATAFTCLLLAGLDLATFSAGLPEALDVIRNANYTMHTAETISGFKRIVGSFPEASAYGSVALAFFTFTLVLWLERFRSCLAGPVTLGLALSIVLCTSTTAYVASVVMIASVVALSAKRLFTGGPASGHAAFIAITVFVIPALVVGLMLIPDLWNALGDLIRMTLLDKADSQSGEERTAWNTLALVAFLETSTFGAGLGTVRASSFAAALLSNVGLAGVALFTAFFCSLIRSAWRNSPADQGLGKIGLAGVFAACAQIVSATISGSSTDLTLLFSIMAGLAAGCVTKPSRLNDGVLPVCWQIPHRSPLGMPVIR